MAAPYGGIADGIPPLTVGMFVEVAIAGRMVDGVRVLPRVALRQGDRVWTVGRDGVLSIRPVQVVRALEDEVLAYIDMPPEDRIIVSQLSGVTDGMQVRLADGKLGRSTVKAPVSWMAKNHVAANLLMGFIMLSGLFAMMQTKKETFPEMSLDQVQIQVPYLGAAPAEVEDAVCKRIEERVRGLEGVRRVRSTASEGMGMVSVELERGADMDKLLDDIKNEIDRIDTFPAEVEEPVIKELTRRNQAIDVVLYGDVEEKALKVAAERVRDDLRSSGVISQVELKGVRVDEIAIEVSEEALRPLRPDLRAGRRRGPPHEH